MFWKIDHPHTMVYAMAYTMAYPMGWVMAYPIFCPYPSQNNENPKVRQESKSLLSKKEIFAS